MYSVIFRTKYEIHV